MKNLIAIIGSPTSTAHRLLSAEALKTTAAVMGIDIKIEIQGSDDADASLTGNDIAKADAVLLTTEAQVDRSRFADKPIYDTHIADTIRNTRAVIETALGLVPQVVPVPTAETVSEQVAGKRLVGITACPTGIAHTFMAATALEKAAKALGHTIKVETQGSVGAKNLLTEEDIHLADAVVIAADTGVDLSRFAGKPLFSTGTKAALHDGQSVINSALAAPVDTSASSTSVDTNTDRAKERTGAYKHLMTGVSYMLPVVIAGGLSIALAFAIGGINAGDATGTLAWALSQIGGATAFHLFVAVLSAFIAYSIADRPGIAAGLIGGMLAQDLGAGFLGGIASGFLAGYITKFLADNIKLPVNLEGLKPVLILPFFSTVIVGLLMIYIVAPPVQSVNEAMTAWLNSLSGTNALLFGAILGGMMAFDMGGPVNKAAYTFAVGLLASKIYTPMAVVMAAGMTPPLALGLAAYLFKNRFDHEEREAGGAALVLGAAFITEGAIPFAAKDPFRVIPALVLGSAVTGAISMTSGVQLLVPHGGVFAVLIPGAVTHLLPYLVAIVAGTIVTTAVLFVLKKPMANCEINNGMPPS
jgi:PTS system fructose-specific IIC component